MLFYTFKQIYQELTGKLVTKYTKSWGKRHCIKAYIVGAQGF